MFHKQTLCSVLIQYQAEEAEKQIKAEFQRLHDVLTAEEAMRLKALSDEEGEKITAIHKLIESTEKDVVAMKELIDTIKKEMGNEDLPLLRNFQNLKRQAHWPRSEPRLPYGSLLNVAKHVGGLGFNVWKKMQSHVKYCEYVTRWDFGTVELPLLPEIYTNFRRPHFYFEPPVGNISTF